MKHLFYFFIYIGFNLSTTAQYYYIPYLNDPGNPGQHNTQISIQAVNSNANASSLVKSGWTLIQESSATPVWSPVQTLPFAFEFNGHPVTQYKVSTSGILTFDVNSITAAPNTIPENLPSTQLPDKSVCVWGINAIGSDDAIVNKTFGTAPEQEHWVFFASFSLGPGFTYWSIMLEEGSNDIYIVDQRQSSDINGGLTLGIQVDNSVGVDVTGSPNVQPVSGGTAVSSDDNYYHFIKTVQSTHDLIGKLSGFDISPNPCSGQLRLTSNRDEFLDMEWKILDQLGKTVMQGKSSNQKTFLIDTDKLSSGLYIFKLQNEDYTEQRRLIKSSY